MDKAWVQQPSNFWLRKWVRDEVVLVCYSQARSHQTWAFEMAAYVEKS